MKILNVLWGFSAGGIGRCFLSYNKMPIACQDITVHSVCINPRDKKNDLTALSQHEIDVISIAQRFDMSWMKALYQRIQSFQPDYIFCHGFNGPVIVWVLKRRYRMRIPMVCSFHGEYHAPSTVKRLVSPVYNWLQSLMYRVAATRVITLEELSKNQLLKKGVHPAKLVIIPNGIADQTIAPSRIERSPGNPVRLTTISRLDAVKGLEYLIKALPETRKKISRPFELTIVGDGPERAKLEKLVAEMKLGGVIRFAGFQNDITGWLHEADIFLLPSLTECHSISLLEAMRAAKTIIATKVGGNTATIRDKLDGLLIPPADTTALAEALTILIPDTELRNRLGQSARKRFLEHFTEERMLTKLAETFKAIA